MNKLLSVYYWPGSPFILYSSHRPELRKAGTVFEDDKRRIIANVLKSPDSSVEQVDKELAKNGFYGSSNENNGFSSV